MRWGRPRPEEARQNDILTVLEAKDYTKKRNRAAKVILAASGVIIAANNDIFTLSPLVNMATQISLAIGVGRLYGSNTLLLHHDNAVEQFPKTAEYLARLDENIEVISD